MLNKYRFFLNLPDLGEREVFPLFDPGRISFTYEKWNEYTNDFKITSNNDFTFYDDNTKENTELAIYKPYKYIKLSSDSNIQTLSINVRILESGFYRDLVTTKMIILDSDLGQYTPNQKKFKGKLEPTSQHQQLQNVFDNEYNILEISGRKTARLISEALDYENCLDLKDVINYLLNEARTGCQLAENPWPFITNTLGITNLLIADKTDIKRPDSSSNATILKLSLLQIFKWLTSLFNLKYRITGTIITFEHQSEFTSINFVLPNDQIQNLINFSYGFDNYEKSILFKYEEAKTPGFLSQDYQFPVNEGSKKEISIGNMNNDLAFIIDNQDNVEGDPNAKDEVNESGATFLACDSDYNIFETGAIPNSKMQLTYLIPLCYANYFFFNDFTCNGISDSVNSLKKRKKSIIKCKKILNFDVARLIETSFGNCEVISAKTTGDAMELTVIF